MTSEGKVPRCHLPWQQMVIDSTGAVAPCCYWGAYDNANPPIGNINDNTIAEVWNNERFQQLRRGMSVGDLAMAGCEKCFALKQGLSLDLDYDRNCEDEASETTAYGTNIKTLKREIAEGREILSANPTIVSYTPSHRCNIRCTHCYQESTRTSEVSRTRAAAEIVALTPYLTRIIAGGGEPFLLPIWGEFLTNFDLTKNPYLDFGTSTNATIVTDRIVDGLSRFKHLTINISLDGIGAVYERVRIGAIFREVHRNISKLKAVVDTKIGSRSSIGCTMSVMKSNILDLVNFIRFCQAEELRFSISPVITMPPDESLCCFNDPSREMRGWADAIEEAKAQAPSLVPTLEVLQSEIPFGLADIPHRRVAVSLPVASLNRLAAQYPGERLVVYVFKRGLDSGNAPYWAPINGKQFEVSLPPGMFCVSISTKWTNAAYWEGLGFAVRGGQKFGIFGKSAARSSIGEIERITARRSFRRFIDDLITELWGRMPLALRPIIPRRLRELGKSFVN
jgi:radical SAM protein with 4Fe4S-binding SPASM domain